MVKKESDTFKRLTKQVKGKEDERERGNGVVGMRDKQFADWWIWFLEKKKLCGKQKPNEWEEKYTRKMLHSLESISMWECTYSIFLSLLFFFLFLSFFLIYLVGHSIVGTLTSSVCFLIFKYDQNQYVN